MSDCEVSNSAGGDTEVRESPPTVENQASVLPGTTNGGDLGPRAPPKKDPRKIAREYQLELCKKALEENVIVYLGTGCGKTHIAVLLMQEMAHLISKPQKSVCVFLAPTVALVEQQANVIEESADMKVGIHCGNSKRLKTHQDWEEEVKENDVLVMTPQILLRNLNHCFIRMEYIALLIFDECHHAQLKSNHPYAEIMRVFYHTGVSGVTKLPRIFGMTASPVVGKDASNESNLPKSINSLEKLLDAKVYSVPNMEELGFVSSPSVRIYDYGPVTTSSDVMYSKLEEIKRQCRSTLSGKTGDLESLRSAKRMLGRVHENMLFCLKNLGLWGGLQACHILLNGDPSEWNELIEAEGGSGGEFLCQKYLTQAAEVFASGCAQDGIASDVSLVDVLKEPFFSRKLLRLIGILSSFRHKSVLYLPGLSTEFEFARVQVLSGVNYILLARLQPNMKCIVFVDRIVTARSLSCILQKLELLSSWKSDFLVGVHSGLKSVSRKNTKVILDRFRSGELNLLVATKVGEEGLDIQTCCLVIRFDLPETVASFIQSRGRARMPQSEYAFLVDSGNQKDLALIENLKRNEERMNLEITFRTNSETFGDYEERTYKVDSSGASIGPGHSVSLLHQYCSKLPHDEYFDPRPKFSYFDDVGGTICHLNLPSNAPVRQIVSTPQSSIEAAKKDACMLAIEELHKMGALNDYLLPMQDDADIEGPVLVSADFNNSKDASFRGELHEMLVPASLKESWTKSKCPLYLNSYYIKFSPYPSDRTYKEFALFLKAALPEEAERMEVDLHLAHGRSVMTKLVPSGQLPFNKEEITQAENFQEMYLKVTLDRMEFEEEFVSLGVKDFCKSSSSTFYLLLPVILHGNENVITVDWKVVRRCLSSPVFRSLSETKHEGVLPSTAHLQLANGCKSIKDIENSLVFVPHKKIFYFIIMVDREKNAHHQHHTSGTSSIAEHLAEKFDIHLKYPEQPLLEAKPLCNFHNLLHNRKQEDTESVGLEEYHIHLPPELCHLKIIGFSKDIGSSLSLLPSVMHRLENLLVAIQLKQRFAISFQEGAEVTASRVLEALTTEKCQERFSLERLEILGDAFLKFAVGRHLFLLHDTLDEGGLTRKRSNIVNNANLFKLAMKSNLQVYIRDQSFDPNNFFAFGRPCQVICTKETEETIHSLHRSSTEDHAEVSCNKGHHLLHRKAIADVVEALVGAFIVDSGFKAAIAFLRWIGIKVDFEATQVGHACIASSIYMPLAASVDMGSLENILEYKFLHKGLLLQAFVHPSYNKHGGGCYQRLEFLGDAVLDYLITSYLYSVFPKLKPGQLTDLRSLSVNNQAFAKISVDKSFYEFILCDSKSLSDAVTNYADFIKRAASDSGRSPHEPKCPKALGDLVESCVGAILLDTGFDLDFVWKMMLSFLDPVASFSHMQLSPFRELHELCQSRNWDLEFPFQKTGLMFLVEGKVTGKGVGVTALATNLNKKEAIRTAARQLYEMLKVQGLIPKSNKSLEEVVKLSCKMEAKLIGYNETPIDVTQLIGYNPTPIDVTAPNAGGYRSSEEQGCLVRRYNPNTNHTKPVTTHPQTSCQSSDTDLQKLNHKPPHISPTSRHPLTPCRTIVNKRRYSGSQPYNSPTHITPASRHSPTPCGAVDDQSSATSSQSEGETNKRSARSCLYEICTANCWKPPLFECCKEEGPGHLKMFTFKAVVEIEAAENVYLQCIGTPQAKKKAAAEVAAKAALWFLGKEGYLDKDYSDGTL